VNELDFILIFIILLCVFIGWRRRSVRVCISIVGFYATVIVIGYLYGPLSDIGRRAFNRLGLGDMGITQSEILTYIILLVVMTVIVELLSRNTFVETYILSIGILDPILGAVVGIFYGLFWASLFLVPSQFSVAQTGDTWTATLYGSTLVPILNDFFQTAVLDVVSIFFTRGVPELFRNKVSVNL
jgi:uncharacterized membrane protein required for colicin V production